MKRLFLLLLIFSVNFIRSADIEKTEYENNLLLAILEASEADRGCINNYLIFSHQSVKSNNCAVKNELAQKANECFMLMPRDIQNPLLYINPSSYLGLANKIYHSISERYKKEQGDKLCKPN